MIDQRSTASETAQKLEQEALDYRAATAIHRARTFELYNSDSRAEPAFVRGWQAATDSMARAILEAQQLREDDNE